MRKKDMVIISVQKELMIITKIGDNGRFVQAANDKKEKKETIKIVVQKKLVMTKREATMVGVQKKLMMMIIREKESIKRVQKKLSK
jgi:hypothetical protein